MAQALDNEILKYLPLLGNDEKKSLLSVIKSFLTLRNESTPMTLDQYNAELNEAEAEYGRGDYITHEEMTKKVDEWKKASTR